MRDQILSVLKEAGTYVSGQELSERLGVSRTAIWKNIKQLREAGYEIEAVTNKGYRLNDARDVDVLNEQELVSRFRTKWAGHPVIYTRQTGSTNDDIMKLSDNGFPEGTLAIAQEQTRGKGRRGRIWDSPQGVNIYMSILLRPKLRPDLAPQATLVMALAIYEALQAMEKPAGVRFGIKWPNDIVVSVDGGAYKKCVGILTEMRMEEMEIRDVTIGTGININQETFPEELKGTATSLKLALGHTVNRAQLTADIWKYFEREYDNFAQHESLEGLQAAYEEGLVNRGRVVRVLDPKGEYTGTAQGITKTGELIVVPDGSDTPVYVGNGEISVRGVMGYV